MDEKQNQQRSLEETRERIGLLAGELASRANPPYVKAKLKDFAEREAEIAKEAALKKALVLKEDVKEAAMKKAVNVKGRVLGSPLTYSLLGALGGWLLGSFIGKKVTPRLQANASSHTYFEEFEGTPRDPATANLGEAREGIAEKASGAVAAAKDKASETFVAAKDKATETLAAAKGKLGSTVSHVRERVPSAHEISDRTSGFIHSAATTRPLIFALVPICLGALLGMLLPMSSRERNALSTAKQKLNTQLSALGERMEQRISSAAESTPKAEPAPITDAPMIVATTPVDVH